jgi:hypothetical protein
MRISIKIRPKGTATVPIVAVAVVIAVVAAVVAISIMNVTLYFGVVMTDMYWSRT